MIPRLYQHEDRKNENFEIKKPSLPINVQQCWSPPAFKDLSNYIVITTMLRNKRPRVREWLEFHIMMGVNYFYIFDHGSSDGLEEVLKPYIMTGQVMYILWPPKELPTVEWNDPLLEAHFYNCYNYCISGTIGDVLTLVNCQQAAFDEIIRRTRGKVRWLGALEIDEYYYIEQNSSVWKEYPNEPLVGAFKKLEEYNIITVDGVNFGTSGWYSFPRRNDDQIHGQLVTKTHYGHVPYSGLNWIIVGGLAKPFANPSCVYGNELHFYKYDEITFTNMSTKLIKVDTYDENHPRVLMNHYIWLSYIDNLEKVKLNGNPSTLFDAEVDRIFNKQWGSPIDYLIHKLEQRMQSSIILKAPVDGHADDWDYTLSSKHVTTNLNILPEAKTDLCISLTGSHIGLIRHSLKSIINYLYSIENKLTYKLIVNTINSTIEQELKQDFPIDAFIQTDQELQAYCTTDDFILHLDESSFARWETWSLEKPSIGLSMQILREDEKVKAVALSDSSNEISEWIQGSKIKYRKNSQLFNVAKAVLTKRTTTFDKDNIYELCLHTQDLCPNNQVRSLFENYQQERMHGYEPGFV